MSDDLKSVESNPKELIGDFYIKVTKNIGSKSKANEFESKNSTHGTTERLINNFLKSDLKSAVSKLCVYEHNQDYILLYDNENQLTSFKLIDLSKIKSAVDYKQNIDNYVSKGSKAIIYPKDDYDLEKLRGFKEQYNTNILAIAPIYIPENTYIFIYDSKVEIKAVWKSHNKLPY